MKQVKILISLIAIIGLTVASLGIMLYIPMSNARAIIVSPRLGNPIRGPSTYGSELAPDEFNEGQVEIMISTEPLDAQIPTGWKVKENWVVLIVPSVMRHELYFELTVEKITPAVNPAVFISDALDTSNIYNTAINLICKLPSNVPPALFDIVVGYKTNVSEIIESSQFKTVQAGSWKAYDGSAFETLLTTPKPFVISEPSCLSIPWIYDAESTDNIIKYDGNKLINPFSLVHISDTHYQRFNENWLSNNSAWESDMMILAPDLIIHTGDLIENAAVDILEYDLAYERLTSIGVPIVVTSGNHDQKNLGPWYHYIGPTFGASRFSDVNFVYFTTTLPISSGILNYLDNQIRTSNAGINLMGVHYPTEPGYASGSWISTLQTSLTHKVDAILTGHYHIDAILPIEEILKIDTLSKIATASSMRQLAKIVPATGEHLGPIERPNLIITRSAAKVSTYSILEEEADETLRYAGYRKFTVRNNQLYNYTYDLNGTGIRDPHASIPVGRFSVDSLFEPNFGINPAAKAYFTLTSNLNEKIEAARVPIVVPNAPNGMKWTLTAENLTSGMYIRAQFSNSTHTWLDVRSPIDANSFVTVGITAI